MSSQSSNAFLFGNRRSACHSCDYHRLGHIGESIFRPESCCRPTERAYSGADVVFYPQLVQPVHLLTNCTVKRRVTCVEPHGHFSLMLCRFYHVNYLLQRHISAVVYLAVFFCIFQQLRIYKRACVNNNISPFNKRFSTHGYKVCRTAACAHKINHCTPP